MQAVQATRNALLKGFGETHDPIDAVETDTKELKKDVKEILARLDGKPSNQPKPRARSEMALGVKGPRYTR